MFADALLEFKVELIAVPDVAISPFSFVVNFGARKSAFAAPL